MNFTWFASAYDTDDVIYRLLTLLQTAGMLILAAGAPSAYKQCDFTAFAIGYVVMRVDVIAQWLRVTKENPTRRMTARRNACGVAVVQSGWLVRLLLAQPWDYIGFGLLAAVELAVLVWAETSRVTSWHRGQDGLVPSPNQTLADDIPRRIFALP